MPATAPPATADLPTLWVVSAYELADLAQALAPQLAGRAQVQVLRGHFEQAAADMRRIAATQRCDVVVSAGSNADFLRSRLDVPVVAVRVGGFDVMAALAEAGAGNARTALLFFREVPPEVVCFCACYGLPVALHAYASEADARALVATLAQGGVQAVVGPGVAVWAARAQGLAGVFLYALASIAAALEEALQLVLAQRAERAGRERLASVLRHLDQGVVATDALGLILAANPAADVLTGVAVGAAVGRPLAGVLPALDAQPHAAARVQEWQGRKVVVKALPVMEAGHAAGAVFTLERANAVEQAFRRLRAHERARVRPTRYTLAHVVQASPQMQALVRRCETLARHSDATVLISGPTGVGKELIAQGIHDASRRRGQPFVAVNCGALAPTLLESELFGYEDGAFTGARREGKAGLFEAAHGGTLLLDEVGELPLDLQTRLLRVLQEREVTRVGGHAPTPVDIRVLSATHRDLRERVRTGQFREDLYYRLAVLRIDVPPLAQRPADLDALAAQIVAQALREAGRPGDGAAVLQALPAVLRRHDWPGNARELHNFAQRVAICCLERGGPPTHAELHALLDDAGPAVTPRARVTLETRRTADERRHIHEVLAASGGSQAEAARRLGISRTTLWRRLRADAPGG